MLYPIRMNFHNGRDFERIAIYFNKNGDMTERDILIHHKEHVLIGGLNGTGKSTIASVYMCILNAPDSDASPEDLISSHKEYTSEEPWIFKGTILFYNDGALEDYSQYIRIVARFRGYSRSIAGIKRPYVEERIFEIYDSDSLAEIESVTPLRFSNTQKYHPLKDYDVHLDKLGISPRKYLLYWKQGATNKFTAVKHSERFDKFAVMLGLDKKINMLDRMEEEQLRRRKDLEILSFTLDKLGLDRQKIKVEADNKIKRDAILKRTAEEFMNISEGLRNFAGKEMSSLRNKHEILCSEISALNLKNEELTESHNKLLEALDSLEKEIGQKDKERLETDEEYAKLKAEAEEISEWLGANEPIYREIQKLISEMERENLIESKELSIEKVAKLVKSLTEQVSELEEIIKSNKSKEIETKITLGEDKSRLINLQEKIDDLKRKVNIAENVIKESPKEYELMAAMESCEAEIKKSEESKVTLIKEKDEILEAASSYLYLLKDSKCHMVKKIETIEAGLEGTERSIDKHKNDKIRAEKDLEVCMSKIEGLSLESLVGQLTASENNYREQLGGLQTAKEHYSETQGNLYSYYIYLNKSIPFLKSQSASLNEQIIGLRARTEAKERDLASKKEQKEKLTEAIGRFPLGIDEYEKEIESMQSKENSVDLKIKVLEEKKKADSEELSSFKEGLFRNVENVELEGDNIYYFHDIFQIVSKDLEESKRLEKRLTLIKDAIFIDAKISEIKPQSQKYHVPLKEFKGYKGSLPFGLVLNDNAPENVASRASEWLKSIANYIDENGVIKDHIGIRGVNAEHPPVLVLNKLLKEWTIRNMEETIEDYVKELSKLSEELLSVRQEKNKLAESRDILKGLSKDIQRISSEIATIDEEINVLKLDFEDKDVKKLKIDNYLHLLNPIYESIAPYKNHLSLNLIVALEYTNDKIVEDKESIFEMISSFDNTIKEIEELNKKISAEKRDIEKLQEEIEAFIENSNISINIRKVIEKLDDVISEHLKELEDLTQEMAQSSELEWEIESNISSIKKYFENVKEKQTELKYEVEELLSRTSDIYSQLRLPLTEIEKKQEDTLKNIEVLRRKLDENYKVLEKVIEANEDLKVLDVITGLEGSKEELSVKIVGLEVLEQSLLKEIENDEKKLDEKKYSRQHFKEYLDKWNKMDLNLYETFNSKEKTRNIINSKLVPLGEKSKKLYIASFELRSRKNEMDGEKDRLLSQMEDLEKEIILKSTVNREMELKLEYYQNHLNYSLRDKEDYRQQLYLNNIEKLTVSDYLPILEISYKEKFIMAIEDGYVKDYDSFVSELNIYPKDIQSEEEFKSEIKGMKNRLLYIFDVLKENIMEESEKKLKLVNEQYDRTRDEKESVEVEFSKNESLVDDSRKVVEDSIHSTVRRTVAVLSDKLDKLGYIVKLNYLPKESNSHGRQLQMFFEKSVYGAGLLREIKSDDGMSGGEHAAISLMIMYAIMKVKEKIDGSGNKQGGYLLLDEWDANLDPINSRIIFGFLEELGKKIISITPRSSYEEYIDKFGVLIRVTNVGKQPMVAMLSKTDSEQIKEMIEEAKSAEE